jgi:uncharacterized protein (DUF58 family)
MEPRLIVRSERSVSSTVAAGQPPDGTAASLSGGAGPVRLTGRGYAVTGAAALGYLLGELLGFALLRAMAGVAFGAVLTAIIVTVRRPRVDISRELHPDRVECGHAALALLRVHNPGAARLAAFTAQDLLGEGRHEIAVRDLAPHATTTIRYRLPTTSRGRVTVGPLTVQRQDPLGLVRNWLHTGQVATLWVHPRRHPVRTVEIGWPRHHHEGSGGPDPLMGSADLRQVREYAVGDEVRHVHWKALARTGTLMVREYTDPAQPRLTVVLDNRSGVLPPAAFEQAVEVATSLCFAAIAAGHRTRLVSTCGDLDLETSTGLTGAREFLDRLAEVVQVDRTGVVPGIAGGGIIYISGGGMATDRSVLARPGVTRARLVAVDLNPAPDRAPAPLGFRTIGGSSAEDVIRTWNEETGPC